MSAITAMVEVLASTSGVPAVYPNRIPDGGPLPAVAYQLIDTVPELALNEVGGVVARTRRVQLAAWAKRYSEAEGIIEHICAALDHRPGYTYVDEDDLYDPDGLVHGRRADYLIWEPTE